jgi:hypothetical protein
MPDDLEDVAEPEELDDLEPLESLDVDPESDPEDDLEVDLVDTDIDLDDAVDEGATVDLAVPEVAAAETPAPAGRKKKASGNARATTDKADEVEDEEEEDVEDEDVEASLDVILKERLVVEDEPEDEEVVDVDERTELTERVRPKQPDEFVCRSCFLVKHPSQLSDRKRMLCRDCV